MKNPIETLLGPKGKLSRAMGKGYEARPGQVEMARAALDVLSGGGALMVEAGTGTGKTIAYLVPAIMSGKKVVISTGTKNLQEQIMAKDLPLAAGMFKNQIRAAMMKGRSNYICKRRLANFVQRPLFSIREEGELFEAVVDWAQTSATGDRAELSILPDNYSAWGDICSKPDLCVGAACRHRETCFITKMRTGAAEADVVVVNHHLFFADLNLREDSYGEVIPRYDAVVFDEAHMVEDIATAYFGKTLSSHRIAEAARDTERELRSAKMYGADAARIIGGLPDRADRFFSSIRGQRDERRRVTRGEAARWTEGAAELANSLNMVSDFLASLKSAPETVAALSIRYSEMAQGLLDYVSMADADNVYWIEPRGRGVYLHSSPIDVSGHLREKLYPRAQGVVFTSATLAAGEDFSFIRKRLGLGPEAGALSIASPFDYQRQAALYLPEDLPDPGSGDFIPKAAARIGRLLEISRGRAFVLFTSHNALEKCWDILGRSIPYTALKQGSAPREAILARFREDTHSVLFGAASFWQGVDVKGESLFAVIIDKLPFATPGDPVVAARIEKIKRDGGEPFMEYQVPSAALALKQGLGRLIRSRDDRGFLAVLDKRIMTKRYGKKFLESLPPFPLVKTIGELEEAAKRLDGAPAQEEAG